MSSRIKCIPFRVQIVAALVVPSATATLAACSVHGPATPTAPRAEAVGPAVVHCDVARDRAAIRAMVGTFRVTFEFEETEPLTEGYAPRPAYRTGATEVVEVLEDDERRIVLQHVLVLGAGEKPTASKHWRQDWTFEDAELVEFRGRRTWERRSLDLRQRACSWTQAVFEVDDAPRYESFGRWSHGTGTSTWTSQETWRPLPRREYTKRSDYDVLVATNRHVVDPSGWQHEQTNTKVVLEGMRPLVRERGLNRYVRISAPVAEVARTYLRDSGLFWAEVRDEWQRVIAAYPRFAIDAENRGEPLYARLLPLAGAAARAPQNPEWRSKMLSTLRSYVRPVGATTTPLRITSR